MAGRMPPRRAVTGRRDSVASADGPRFGAGGPRRVRQFRAGGRTSGAGRPFQSGASLPGRGGTTAVLVPCSVSRRCRSGGALPLAGWERGGRLPRPVPLESGRSFRWSALGGMAAHHHGSSARDSGWDGVRLPKRDRPSSSRAHVHVPMAPSRPHASLLERRIPDGGVPAVTRSWGQPLS
jgi:hypothetical protein